MWLVTFTARDLAGALHCSLEVAQRGVKALLWHGICEVLEEDFPGPEGPEPLIGYIPLPEGPKVHPREAPPEVVVPREMGGDPLRVVRGMPIGSPAYAKAARHHSTAGTRRPGRTQIPKHVREAQKKARRSGLAE